MAERELLREAHELLATVLLACALHQDINANGPIGQRIKSFNTRLREMGVVGADGDQKAE